MEQKCVRAPGINYSHLRVYVPFPERINLWLRPSLDDLMRLRNGWLAVVRASLAAGHVRWTALPVASGTCGIFADAGASAKVGICTRGKFEKFDWWTKKKESGGPNGEGDDELRRVKRFEQQLLEEAL